MSLVKSVMERKREVDRLWVESREILVDRATQLANTLLGHESIDRDTLGLVGAAAGDTAVHAAHEATAKLLDTADRLEDRCRRSLDGMVVLVSQAHLLVADVAPGDVAPGDVAPGDVAFGGPTGTREQQDGLALWARGLAADAFVISAALEDIVAARDSSGRKAIEDALAAILHGVFVPS